MVQSRLPSRAPSGLAAAAMALFVGSASAQPGGVEPPTPVVAVVKVAKPWYAPQRLVTSRMRETIPQYASLPGLAHKAFSFARADAHFGGIYLWRDRASADAWFDAAWFARVEKERGVKGDVRLFDAPVVIDNTPGGTPASSDSRAVATLVTIAVPAGVTRERLVAEFKAAVPAYQRAAGLLRKAFIVTADGRFGGVYLWSDQAAADRWFDAAWHARVASTYGGEARLEWFDTPILLPSTSPGNAVAMAQP